MNSEEIREYCLNKKEVTEGMPFGETNVVFKVFDKMFALMMLEGELSLNLKCEPEIAESLRERYDAVTPGYHMNKRHWNTVLLDGSVQEALIKEWIDHSYELVVSKLPKKKQEGLL